MFRDATYTGITPQFWGSMDAVAGRDEWRLHGLTNCGQGPAGQTAHVSHGTSPARFRGVQVGVRLNALDIAGIALEHAGADEATSRPLERSASRASRARAAPADACRRHSRHVRAVRDGAVGVAVTNRTSDDGLREVARARGRRRRRIARSRLPGCPEPPPPGRRLRRRTAALGRTSRRGSRRGDRATGDTPAYGFFTSGVTELAVVSTTGLEVSQRLTDATVSFWPPRRAVRLRDADLVRGRRRRPARVRGRGGGEGDRTSGARELEPQVYRAVLEPYALAELLQYFAWDSLRRLGLLEERSYLTGRLGERVFDEKVSIWDDALDPRGLPKAFDFEGVPSSA
jgi:predicted Zn-dependent protease